jgi:hypothetical protein
MEDDLVSSLAAGVTWFERLLHKLSQIDWDEVADTFNKAIAAHVEAARKLAMKGWTVPAWMGLSDAVELCELSEVELDERFTVTFTANNFRVLNERIVELTGYPEMAKWKPLLLEVRDSIMAGRHQITIPALLTILEGYSVTCVLKGARGRCNEDQSVQAL